jgi:hypothetical protein
MSGGRVSYLITIVKLMQNKGYVYSVLLDFLDNSNGFETWGWKIASSKWEQASKKVSLHSQCKNLVST